MFMTPTIISNLFSRYATRLYPFVPRTVEGSRGGLNIDIDKCVMCKACAVRCPTNCLTVEAEKGLWEREVMACIYCGVCADCCPTDCISMTIPHNPPMTGPEFSKFQGKPRVKKAAKSASTKAAAEEAAEE